MTKSRKRHNRTIYGRRKGFTLIELLVVIAVIAVLSIVVILTLNPAELLRQSRDSARISDFSTLRTAISLYILDVTSSNIVSSTLGYAGCYLSSYGSNATTTANCSYFKGGFTLTNGTSTQANYKKNDSSGWLPINFTQISSGAPFGSLPADPTNNLNYFYAYAATSSPVMQFELETAMESKKYGFNGANDVVSSDGGNSTSTYEVGSTMVF